MLYFGRNNCPSCQEFIQILRHILNYTNIKICYFDTNDKGNKNYDYLIDNYEITQVPSLLQINNASNSNNLFVPKEEGIAIFLRII